MPGGGKLLHNSFCPEEPERQRAPGEILRGGSTAELPAATKVVPGFSSADKPGEETSEILAGSVEPSSQLYPLMVTQESRCTRGHLQGQAAAQVIAMKKGRSQEI